MSNFIWIEKTDCIGFHNILLARPQQLLSYGKPSHFDLAASYAHGIVKNHPFVDGNKRSGLMAAALFLQMNGWIFHPPEEEAVIQTLALAAGELDCEAFSDWLRRSCSPR